jgi:hypothetical protein
MKKILTVLLIGLTSFHLAAQKEKTKVKFGLVKPEDFQINDFPEAEEADAVYLLDDASAVFTGNNNSGMSVIYSRHVKILLKSKNTFDDLGSVSFILRQYGLYREEMTDLEAATHKLQNGQVVSTKLEKSNIFKQKLNENTTEVKFTFPSLEEGCIIEYQYKEEDPYDRYIPSFYFQSRYPKILSRYVVEIPNYYDFTFIRKGYVKPSKDTSIVETRNYQIVFKNGAGVSEVGSFTTKAFRHIWEYEKIPGLYAEKFIHNIDEYRNSIAFQLSMTHYPNSLPEFHRKDWYSLVKELKQDEDFGADFSKNNNWLDALAAETGVPKNTTSLEDAKKVFYFVRDNFTCTDDVALYLSQPHQKTLKERKGNVVDVNLLLMLLYKYLGMEVSPVLVSTRDNGKPNEIFPMLSDYNYVIIQLSLGGKLYNLDASKKLGFGLLSESCYGGGARLISDNPYIIPLQTDSLSEKKLTTVFIIQEAGGRSAGHLTQTLGQIESEKMRKSMQKSSKAVFFETLKSSFTFPVDINNTVIDSLNSYEDPVRLEYDLQFKFDEDLVYFNPLMNESISENPFSAASRIYPVEMEYCQDETYTINMEIPAEYEIVELPKSAKVMFNESEGFYEYLIQSDGSRIMFRSRLKLNKASFESSDYESLRDFYAFIIQKMGEQIVFKKK